MPGFVINQVAVSGNLTKDPDTRTLPSGTSVTTLRLAVNERVKSDGEWQDRANFFDVTIWGAIGEAVARQLGKGDRIAVSGRLRWREWQDKDGNGRQAVDIVADSVLPVPKDGQRSGGGGGSSRPEPDVPADTGDFDRPLPGADEEIPF